MQETPIRGQRPDPHHHRDLAAEPDPVAARICDRHGAAMFSVAVALVHDRRRAETAVVEAICAAYDAPALSELPVGELRRDLARRVYQRCGGAVAVGAASPDQRLRIALTLVQQGGFTYRQVADLLALPSSDVVDLLDAGLRAHVSI